MDDRQDGNKKIFAPEIDPQWHKSMNAQQRSRWIAFMADKTKIEEEQLDWKKVPKNQILGLGLIVPKISIVVPKISDHLNTFKLQGSSSGIGTMVDKQGNIMYAEADSKGAVLFKIGHISEVNAKLYNMMDVKTDKGNAIAIDLPGNLFMIPLGNQNFKFIQYKDGLREMVGARDRLLGQVIGSIVDKFGNYIYAYYDNTEQVIILMMDNVFSRTSKISLSVQGIDKKTLINPFAGKFGNEAKIIEFPVNRLLN